MRSNKCCICGNRIAGYGNNPWPVSTGRDDRCCDRCDQTVVIPARIRKMLGE